MMTKLTAMETELVKLASAVFAVAAVGIDRREGRKRREADDAERLPHDQLERRAEEHQRRADRREQVAPSSSRAVSRSSALSPAGSNIMPIIIIAIKALPVRPGASA